MSHVRCYGIVVGRSCPLGATRRVTGLGGSMPFCWFHARRWRHAREYVVSRLGDEGVKR